MYIKSNYKDYYDNVAHRFGGDPKIVYVRPNRIKNIPDMEKYLERISHGFAINSYKSESMVNITKLYRIVNNERIQHDTHNEENKIRGIVIGEYLFIQIKYKTDQKYRLVKESDLLNTEIRFYPDLKIEKFINYKDESLLSLCKKVGLPVFSFNYSRISNFQINDLIPNLGCSGIPYFISDTDMYQYLSYLIGNKMRDCPDMMPQVNISDKDKIIGHGFDYKTSFRGK